MMRAQRRNVSTGWAVLALAAAVGAGGGRAGGGEPGEIGFVEDYALAENREAALAKLVPGTDEHFYWLAIHHAHEGRLDDADAVVQRWDAARGVTPPPLLTVARNRLAALRYAQDRREGFKRIQERVAPSFNHQPDLSAPPTHPTALPDGFLSAAPWRKTLLSIQETPFHLFEPAGLDALENAAWATDDVRGLHRADQFLREFGQRVARPDHPGLVDAAARSLRARRANTGQYDPRGRYNGRYAQLPVRAILTRAQLEELGRLLPDLKNDRQWVADMLARMVPDADQSGPGVEPADEAWRAAWNDRWTFVQTLAPAFLDVKAATLAERLLRDRARGEVDFDRFKEYLALPRRVAYARDDWMRRSAERASVSVAALPSVNDEAWVRDFFLQAFARGEAWDGYAAVVRDDWLKPLYAEAMLTAGKGDAEEMAALLGSADHVRRLQDRVDLDFLPDNPEVFADGRPVRLKVAVKNVPALTVKVFRVNTLNWYKAHAGPVTTDIDLDGLVAGETRELKYDEPAFRRVVREFDFPALDRPGVYVIEFVGGGRANRAVVRRGALRFVERPTVAGHAFTVLDENHRPVKGAELWIGNQRHTADQDDAAGEILVPYSTTSGRRAVILCAGDFADLGFFEHRAEIYDFDAAFLVEREQLRKGGTARLVVRPSLSVHGRPAPLAALEEARLRIDTVDRFGVAATRTFDAPPLREDAESVHEFAVPDDLAHVAFTLTAKVRNLTAQRDDALAAADALALNGIDRANRFESLHFGRAAGGAFIDVRGKTGEPRPGRPVLCWFKHREFATPKPILLQSGSDGRIALGGPEALAGIDFVFAKLDGHANESLPSVAGGFGHPDAPRALEANGYFAWTPGRDDAVYPDDLHAPRGEAMHVPYMGAAEARDRLVATLLETRGGVYVRDRSDALALRGGYLEIAGLEPGDYELRLKEGAGHTVRVRVTDGPREDGYARGQNRLLQLANPRPLQLAARAEGDALRVMVANADAETRVHVVATRYAPYWDAFAPLAFASGAPAGSIATPPPRSVYLSGRDIGDEYRYVLERRGHTVYAGSTLARPGLILQPLALRETETTVQVAREGEAVQAVALPSAPPAIEPTRTSAGRFATPRSWRARAGAGLPPPSGPRGYDDDVGLRQPGRRPGPRGEADTYLEADTIFAKYTFPEEERGRGLKKTEGRETSEANARLAVSPNLDWRATPSVVLANRKPGADGALSIPLADLDAMREVAVVAVNGQNAVVRRVLLPDRPQAPRDLRMADALDPARHFVRAKRITRVAPGRPFAVADADTARTEIYDSLPDLYRLFATLSGHPAWTEFEFLARWPALSEKEKREKYEKYACHELNLFVARKDRAFFDRAVKPYIANKRDKAFMDDYLLASVDDYLGERRLAPYLETAAFARLNTAERLLLAERVPDADARAIRRAVRDANDLRLVDRAEWNRVFDTALRRGALDAGPGGAGTPVGEVRTEAGVSPKAPSGPPPAMAPFPAFGAAAAPAPPDAAEAPRRDAPAEATAGPDRLPATPAEEAAFADDGRVGEARGLRERTDDLSRRAGQRIYYRQVDATKEWIETGYWQRPEWSARSGPGIAVNDFWADFAAWGDTSRLATAVEPFVSPNFADCRGDFAAMAFCLALTDLPFESPKHAFARDGRAARLDPAGPALVFHEEIEAADPADGAPPVLVAQQYFRDGDRFRFEGNRRLEKFVADEFLVNVVYGALVAVTNPTGAPRDLSLLLQVPQGALPVANGFRTRVVDLTLNPYQTQVLEYRFYFPGPGRAAHYPAHVVADGRLAAFAPPVALPVVREPATIDTTTWDYVSQRAAADACLAFLREQNLGRVDLGRIAWRMGDPAFFGAATAILRERRMFHPTLWSYALRFAPGTPGFDERALREFLESQPFAAQVGAWLDTPALKVDPVARGTYRHLEYSPLVHARAHALGGRRRIMNPALLAQYHRFLDLVAHKPALDDEDRLAAAYYLFLQDRLVEGERFFRAVDAGRVAERAPYDYMAAWLAMARADAPAARAVAVRYADYPAERWRKLFAEVAGQLDQAEGRAAAASDADSREQALDRLAAAAPTLDLAVADKAVVLRYQHLDAVEVRYYRMDLELLFSRNPFAQQFASRFAYVAPNAVETVRLPAGGEHRLRIPEALQREHVLVEVKSDAGVKGAPYFAGALAVRTVENYGQVRVASAADGRPVARAYVKVYARGADGRVAFHKDGYTDLRGVFDYATLSAGGLDAVARFALLVDAPGVGAAMLEAEPPRR